MLLSTRVLLALGKVGWVLWRESGKCVPLFFFRDRERIVKFCGERLNGAISLFFFFCICGKGG